MRQCGGRDCLGEQTQPSALLAALLRQRGLNSADRRVPAVHPAHEGDGLGTVRIVQRENRRLGKRVRGAETRGVIGIAFDLRGATLMAFDQKPGGDSPQCHRGGKVKRFARH